MFSSKLLIKSMRCVSSLTFSKVPTNHGIAISSFDKSQFDNSIRQKNYNPERHISISASLSQASSNQTFPPKPRRPNTPFIAFLQERRDQLRNQRPNAPQTEVVSILSKEWNQTDKSKYEEDYRRRRDEYLKELENYNNSLSDEQRKFVEQEVSKKRNLKTKRELASTNPPKKPRSATNLFISHRFKDYDVKDQLKSAGVIQILRNLSEEYKNLSSTEKQKFIAMAEADIDRYKQEFLDWYKNVQKRTDLRVATRHLVQEMRQKHDATYFD